MCFWTKTVSLKLLAFNRNKSNGYRKQSLKIWVSSDHFMNSTGIWSLKYKEIRVSGAEKSLKENRSTEEYSKIKLRNMTASEEIGPRIRTRASPKWVKTRCRLPSSPLRLCACCTVLSWFCLPVVLYTHCCLSGLLQESPGSLKFSDFYLFVFFFRIHFGIYCVFQVFAFEISFIIYSVCL